MAWIAAIVAWGICFAVSVCARFKSVSFTRADSGSAIRLDEPWIDRSLVSCIWDCKIKYSSCASVVYNGTTGLCSPGSIAVNVGTYELTATQGDFFSQSICNASLGFSLYQYRRQVTCLYISSSTADFFEARRICASLNAIMYMAKTQEKLDLFNHLVRRVGKNMFIGLTDLVQEGAFVWEDGEPLDPALGSRIFFWHEPDNHGGGQDCVNKPSFQSHDKLYDNPCTYSLTFICERI